MGRILKSKAVPQVFNRRTAVHLLIAIFFTTVALVLLVSGWDKHSWALSFAKLKIEGEENATIDYRIVYHRPAKADPALVFLTIDTASIYLNALDPVTIQASPSLSLMKAGGFPYPRSVYADVFARLLDAGAKVVALDINFQASKPDDAAFKAALDKYRDHVVIGMNFSDDLEHGSSPTLSIPPETLFPDQDSFDDRLGFLNFWPDPDTVIRKAQYRTNVEHVDLLPGAEKLPKLYSLAARSVLKSGRGDLIPDDLVGRSIRYARPKDFSSFSLYQIFEPSSWEKDFHGGAFFKDKIVLIGPRGNWSKDELITPLGQMNGAEIHLNAMNALLQNEFLYPASDRLLAGMIVGSGATAFLLAMLIVAIFWRFVAAALLLGGYGFAVIATYNGPGWLLPVMAPCGVFCGATGLGFIYDFVLAQIEKRQLRATFERYTSKNVARYLLDHSDGYKEMLAGTHKPVTILFSDVRNFTVMTEVAAAQGLSKEHIAKLNEYLTAMVACVFRYDGSLDKFIGDAVMAVWGNTPYNFGPKEDAVRAVRAVRAMQVELRLLNAQWKEQGKEPWAIGIGLNHGEVIVGDMGSQQRKEFAVLGDAVNLASRLESLTKEYKVEILIGNAVAELVRSHFHLRSVDVVQVKGKTQAVQIFTVLGESSQALSARQQGFLKSYEEGVLAFRARDFARARELFTQALQVESDDYLSGEYLKSCDELLRNPPDASWAGVRVMDKK